MSHTWPKRSSTASDWPNKKDLGNWGEQQALLYLKALNYRPETQNVTFWGGQIDLIMWDKEELVFVEVKTRSSWALVPAEATLPYHQLQTLVRSARRYLAWKKKNDLNWRLDLVVITPQPYQIEHFKNVAFLRV